MIPSLFLYRIGRNFSIFSLQRYMRQPENPEHQEFFDLISSMLMYDPTERYTLREVFQAPFFAPLFKTEQTSDSSDRDRSHSTSRWLEETNELLPEEL